MVWQAPSPWAVSFGSSDRWSGASLTDAQWARIEPLLPDRTPRGGGRWRDHRQVIDDLAWQYRTGSLGWICPPSSGRGKESITGCGSAP
ncbi:transposase [Streptomyces sp. NBC_01481]|uniref:transposase n=1 Tax=Streptomyces sp. NBC_01481 TaxID=2975869 RepID=UPI00225BF970|nr:transposase [Streptomyces sp. NBC_01481]MCX4586190.1 transposase [Streptomyces sp. NBC_01481]